MTVPFRKLLNCFEHAVLFRSSSGLARTKNLIWKRVKRLVFVCWLAWGFACVLTRSVRLVTVARQTPKLLHLVINISASDWPDAVWDGHFVGLVTPSSGIKGREGLWVASRMQVRASQGIIPNPPNREHRASVQICASTQQYDTCNEIVFVHMWMCRDFQK